MFKKIMDDDSSYNQCIEFFLERFVYTTVEIEKALSDEQKVIEKKILFDAFHELLAIDRPLDYFDVQNLGNEVNQSAGLYNFRKINVSSGSDFVPVDPLMIRQALYTVMDDYKNSGEYLDVFEREARLAIELMRIHCFEDGNKRVVKLLLNSNLIKQGVAPVIITKADNEIFYKFINNRDYAGFAEFLRQRSEIENLTLVGYVKSLYQDEPEKVR